MSWKFVYQRLLFMDDKELAAHAAHDVKTQTHTHTHFDTGFPLKLNFSAGKEGEGTERCMSQQNCTVEQCFDRCAVASLCTSQLCEKVGKFVGSIMNYHGNKKRIGTACSTVVCRYVGQRPGRYPQDTAESFVKWSSAGLLHSPAYIRWLSKVVEKHGKSGGGRPFVQGWTHTQSRFRRGQSSSKARGLQ